MGHWPSGLSNIKLTKLTYYEQLNTIYWNWFIYKTVEFLNLKMYTSRHKYAAFLSRDFMLLKPFYSLFFHLSLGDHNVSIFCEKLATEQRLYHFNDSVFSKQTVTERYLYVTSRHIMLPICFWQYYFRVRFLSQTVLESFVDDTSRTYEHLSPL